MFLAGGRRSGVRAGRGAACVVRWAGTGSHRFPLGPTSRDPTSSAPVIMSPRLARGGSKRRQPPVKSGSNDAVSGVSRTGRARVGPRTSPPRAPAPAALPRPARSCGRCRGRGRWTRGRFARGVRRPGGRRCRGRGRRGAAGEVRPPPGRRRSRHRRGCGRQRSPAGRRALTAGPRPHSGHPPRQPGPPARGDLEPDLTVLVLGQGRPEGEPLLDDRPRRRRRGPLPRARAGARGG